MNSEGTFSKKELRQVSKLNIYFRDKCEIPFKESYALACIVVEQKDFILDVLKEDGEK